MHKKLKALLQQIKNSKDTSKDALTIINEVDKEVNQQQQEIDELKSQFDELQKTVTQVFFRISNDGNWLFLSHAFYDMLGLEIADVLHTPAKNLIHPDDIVTFSENCDLIANGGLNSALITIRLLGKNGVKWVEFGIHQKHYKDGRSYFTGNISDIDKTYRIQKDNDRLALVAKRSQNLVVITDPNVKITYVNQAFEATTGYTLREVQGKSPGSFLQGSGTDKRTVKRIREALDARTHFQGEILNYSKDGNPYWLDLSIDPVFDDHQNLTGYIAVEAEVSERKEKEINLAKVNVRLNSLLENLNSGVLVEDENRRIVLTNKQFLAFFEIPGIPEEMVGLDCSQGAEQTKHLIEGSDQFVSRLQEILDARKPVAEERIYFKDGRVMARDYVPITIDDIYYGHLWQYREITDRIQYEQSLRASEEKYRTLLENLNIGLLEVDITGKIKAAFPGFCQLTGYTSDELVGQKAADILVDQQGKQLAAKQLANRKKGNTAVYEQHIIRKDGSSIWVLISATPVFDSKKNVIGAIGIHMDITQRREDESKLKSYAFELESINKELDQFAYIVSHDLKAPLRAINNLATWIEEDLQNELNEELQNNFNLLKGRVARMENLINGILQYSRAGRLGHKKELVNVKALLEEVIESITSQKKVDVLITSDMPEVVTERITLRQIFANLISNGIKYNSQERPVVRISCSEKSNKYLFSVEDNGIGIDERYHDRIFQIFQTLQARDQVESTGVGLAIVKKMLEEKECNIWINSELKKGTTFTFEWPK